MGGQTCEGSRKQAEQQGGRSRDGSRPRACGYPTSPALPASSEMAGAKLVKREARIWDADQGGCEGWNYSPSPGCKHPLI